MTETDKKKLTAFRSFHKNRLREKIKEGGMKGIFATEEWNDGNLVIKGTRVRKITKSVPETGYSGALHHVPYKLYFDSSKDAERLASVVGFASSIRVHMETGRYYFKMPPSIQDDTDEWEKYLTPVNGGEAPRREAPQREAPRKEAPRRA